MASLLYLSRQQVVGGDGRPVAGAKLYTYATGTSTPKSVWTDAALSVAHANPVVADADGRLPLMYVSSGDYRVSLQTPDNTVIFTDDPVPGAAGAVVNPETGWVQIEAQTVSAQASVNFDLSVSYKAFRLRLLKCTADASRQMHIRFSTDGGSTFVSGTSYIQVAGIAESTGGTISGASGSSLGLGQIANFVSNVTDGSLEATVEIVPGTASLGAIWRSSFTTANSTTWYVGEYAGVCAAGAVTNAVRIFTGSSGAAAGSFSGTLILEGLR